MNKQRKVLITTTYNEMGIIIDTKAEEVAQSNLQPTCNNLATDTISRQAAIRILEDGRYSTGYCKEHGIDHSISMEMVRILLNDLPSAQSKQLQVLADVLDGCPLTQPCDKMWKPDGWCKEHCKTHEPDAECWLKYAEVMASDDETNTSDLQKLHMKRESIL